MYMMRTLTYSVVTFDGVFKNISLSIVPVVLHEVLVPLEEISVLAKLGHC